MHLSEEAKASDSKLLSLRIHSRSIILIVTIEALSTGCSNEQQHQNKQYSYIKINGHLCVINDSVVDVNLLNDTPSTRNAQRDTPPHILENILQRESLSTELNNNNIDNYANGNGNEDGIQMISISPNGHVKMHSISSPLTNVKDRIHALRFFKRIQNGSVVVIVTQNSCVLKYPAWPNMIKYTTALDVGPWHWRDSEQQQRDIGLIVGCYGYCPRYVFDKGTSQMTRSQIPFNIFSTAADVGKDDKNDGLLRYKIKFGLKGIKLQRTVLKHLMYIVFSKFISRLCQICKRKAKYE